MIKLFEQKVLEKISDEIKNRHFVSSIKNRDLSFHLKLMLKKQKNNLLIDTDEDFNLNKIKEYHKLGNIYNIIVSQIL